MRPTRDNISPSSSSLNSTSRVTKKNRSSTSTSSVSAAVMALKATAAENLKLRERKLREDPMCIIINPKRVKCSRCGIEIQLSKKSDFDACHWNKHRERCLKKRSDGQPRSKKPREVRPPRSSASEIRIISAPRAASLASTTPSLEPDVDVDIDDDADVPLSPLTSISSGLPSPVSSIHGLAPSFSPKAPRFELPKSKPTLTTIPKTEPVASSLPSAPPAPPPIITTALPLPAPMPLSAPPRTFVPKSPGSPFRLDYREVYNHSLGTPLDFPPTEYFRWSQLRTSYDDPDVSDVPSREGSAGGSVTPTATAGPSYPLSAARFDHAGTTWPSVHRVMGEDDHQVYDCSSRMESGFTASFCRFSR